MLSETNLFSPRRVLGNVTQKFLLSLLLFECKRSTSERQTVRRVVKEYVIKYEKCWWGTSSMTIVGENSLLWIPLIDGTYSLWPSFLVSVTVCVGSFNRRFFCLTKRRGGIPILDLIPLWSFVLLFFRLKSFHIRCLNPIGVVVILPTQTKQNDTLAVYSNMSGNPNSVVVHHLC